MTQSSSKKLTVVKHESAGGIVFHIDKQQLYVALIQNKWGDWTIPKGHIESKETPQEAAIREIKEETGIIHNLQLLDKIGVNQHKFKLSDDNRTHSKKVHVFLFVDPQKSRLRPLSKEEGIKRVRWVPYQEALEITTHKAERDGIQQAQEIIKEANIIPLDEHEDDIKKIVKQCVKRLGNTLFAIVGCGSLLNPRDLIASWSDIDLLIIVDQLDFNVKQKIAQVVETLESEYKIRFGINIITKEEAIQPKFPSLTHGGKTLQTLLDANEDPQRILYCKVKKPKLYVPTRNEIKTFSLVNIGMLVLRNRRSLIRVPDDLVKLKELVAQEIRGSYILTRLGVELIGHCNCKSKKDIIEQAKITFPNFDFKFLANNLLVIKRWGTIKNRVELLKLLRQADRFIENFSQHVYKKAARY